MAAESRADLTTDNDNNVVLQTAPESIGPGELGSNTIQKIIDSMWNQVDDLLTLPARDVTKVELATAIGASSLNDRTNGFSVNQVLKITDRTDTFPLYVQITSANTISPFGVWVKGGTTPLAVIMDYVNGYQGETNPFIAIFDENRNLKVVTPIIIQDGTEGVGKTLTGDGNGKTTWVTPAIGVTAVLNPAALAAGTNKMLGLAASITPNKSGYCLIIISGEYATDSPATSLIIKTGLGAAPANGDASLGASILTESRLASSADRIPFSLNVVRSLSTGSTHWIDMSVGNGNIQFYNVSVSIIEL